jgi:hypothetical protein
MTREAGWGKLKAKLRRFGASELLTLIHDLYQASPENRQFLRGRLLPSAADLERYRSRVMDAVYPDPFSRKRVRVGEAERLIRHYRLSTGDRSGVVELMLTMVEAGTEQAAVPDSARPAIVQRLGELAWRAESVGWGYGDAVREITLPAISPSPEGRPQRRARRS